MTRIKATALAGAVAAAGFASSAETSSAQAAMIDCKIILCLAGGFPSGCSDAYRKMIRNLTRIPPKPPFGFCAMSDGRGYEGTDVDYGWLTGRESWTCPAGTRLHWTPDYDDNGFNYSSRGNAFCYTSSQRVQVGWGRDTRYETRFIGRQAATPVNFRIQVTVEPGTPAAYRSPTYHINTRTGFSQQTPSAR